jgi:uncharacterized RDD family membrane protein YckC
MYCPICGKPRQPGGDFCPFCGKPLPSIDDAGNAVEHTESGIGGDGSSPRVAKAATQAIATAVIGAPDPSNAPWTCPSCGIINTPGSRTCECGYGGESTAGEKIVLPSPPRPWLRYWARTVDVVLAVLTFSLICGAFGLDVAKWNNYVIWWAGMLLWIPFEAAFLSSSGTTPGKWLFNIRLADNCGGRLPFAICLGRAFAVVLKGQGLGIPIVVLITTISAYSTLTSQGRTPWDTQYGVVVKHGHLGAGRIMGIILTFIVILTLIGLGNSMK